MELLISDLIHQYQTQHCEESFSLLLARFQPLITKYTRRLYYLDPEDSQQELRLAVYEAINNMTQLDNEYACISYINKSIYHKFCKLYSASVAEQKKNDTQVPYEDLHLSAEDTRMNDQLFFYDFHNLLNQVSGSKRRIL